MEPADEPVPGVEYFRNMGKLGLILEKEDEIWNHFMVIVESLDRAVGLIKEELIKQNVVGAAMNAMVLGRGPVSENRPWLARRLIDLLESGELFLINGEEIRLIAEVALGWAGEPPREDILLSVLKRTEEGQLGLPHPSNILYALVSSKTAHASLLPYLLPLKDDGFHYIPSCIPLGPEIGYHFPVREDMYQYMKSLGIRVERGGPGKEGLDSMGNKTIFREEMILEIDPESLEAALERAREAEAAIVLPERWLPVTSVRSP